MGKKGDMTNPRPVAAEIKKEGPPFELKAEVAIEVADAVGGRAGERVEPAGEGVAAIEALGRLLGVVKEAGEAVVGVAPGVPEGLAGGHPPRKPVEVAPAECPDGDGGAGTEAEMETGVLVEGAGMAGGARAAGASGPDRWWWRP